MEFQRLNEAIRVHIRNSHTWLEPSMMAYFIFSLFSSLGRPDVNVAVSMLGLFFIRNYDHDQRIWFCLLLLTTFALDVVWLVINHDFNKHFDLEGVSFQKGVTSLAYIVSILNMIVKVALIISIFHIEDRKSGPSEEENFDSHSASNLSGLGSDIDVIGGDDEDVQTQL